MNKLQTQDRPTGWNIFILYILTFSLLPLFLLSFYTFSESTQTILLAVDTIICALLFTDFCIRFVRSPSKLAYMRWGWIDLLSCIPFFLLPYVEWSRWIRIFRLITIIRRIGSFGRIIEHLFHNPLAGTMYTTLMLGILVIVLGAELFYEAEIGIEGSLIHSFADALWWTITTLTTVGYGDIYPVSPLGRGVAATLMLFGIALYGSVTTMIAQLLARGIKKSSEEMERSSLTKELDKKIRAANLSKTEKEEVVTAITQKLETIHQARQADTSD